MAIIPLRAYNREIEGMIDNGQLDEAVAHCRHILATFPKHIATYRLLGKAHLEQQRISDATDVFQRVLSSIPDDFIANVGMSIIREDENNLDSAIWHMELAYEAQPANAAIQDELRRLYGRRDGMQPPKVRTTRGALAKMYAKGDLYDLAMAELRAAIAEDPNRPDLSLQLAEMFFQSGQRVEAVETCANILKKLPFCLEANRMLAVSLPEVQDSDASRNYGQVAISMDPYFAFAAPEALSSDQVPDNAVNIERLDYKSGIQVPETPVQPNWAASLGISIDKPADEHVPEWLKTAESTAPVSEVEKSSSGVSPFIWDTQEVGNIVSDSSQPEEKIPDWMKDAGWHPSSGEPAQPPEEAKPPEPPAEVPQSDDLEKAEIPDWLRGIAPEGILGEEQPAETPSESTLSTPWLEQHQPGPTDSIVHWLEDNKPEAPKSRMSKEEEALQLPDDEVPDWLKDLEPASSTALGRAEPASSTPAFSMEPSEASPSAPSPLEPAGEELQRPANEGVLPQSTFASEPAEAEEEIPEWLRQLAGEPAPAESPLPSQESPPVAAFLSDEPQTSGQQPTPSQEAAAEDQMQAEGALAAEQSLAAEPASDAETPGSGEIPASPEQPSVVEEALPPSELPEAEVPPAAELAEIPAEPSVVEEALPPSELPEAEIPSEAELAEVPAVPSAVEEALPPSELPEAVVPSEAELAEVSAEPSAAEEALPPSEQPEPGIPLAEELPAVEPPPMAEQILAAEESPLEPVVEAAEEFPPAEVPSWAEELGEEGPPISEEAPASEQVIPTEALPSTEEAPAAGEVPPAELTSEAVQPAAPELPSTPEAAAQIELAAQEEPEMETFAWLEELAAEHGEKKETPPVPVESGEIIPPDWVKMEIEPPADESLEAVAQPPEAAPIPAEEIPDWIKGLGEEPEPASTSEEPPPAVTPEIEMEPSDELPAWLRELEESEPEKAEAGLAPEGLEWKSDELPAWLKEITESEPQPEAPAPAEVPPAEEPAPAEAKDVEQPVQAEVPFEAQPAPPAELSEEQLTPLEAPVAEQPSIIEAPYEEEPAPQGELFEEQPAQIETPVAEQPAPAEAAAEEQLTPVEELAQEEPVQVAEPGVVQPAQVETPPVEEPPVIGEIPPQATEPAIEWSAEVTPPAGIRKEALAEALPEPEPILPPAESAEPPLPEPVLEPVEAEIPSAAPEVTPAQPDASLQAFQARSQAHQAALGDARSAVERGEPYKAVELYDQLIRQNYHLDEIIQDLNDALYRFPVDVELWVTLGDAHLRADDLPQALSAYTKAEELAR